MKSSRVTLEVFYDEGSRAVVSDRRILQAKELLRVGEVMDILRISRSQVRRLCESGDLEDVRFSQRIVRIKSRSVLEYLERSEIKVELKSAQKDNQQIHATGNNPGA